MILVTWPGYICRVDQEKSRNKVNAIRFFFHLADLDGTGINRWRALSAFPGTPACEPTVRLL